ncbi:hypothetical protein [Acetivibrio straminisolvens]|uniref:Membrane protein n=1 Tax=Acetivibrio straminisolvens JCM 21531 TaxID=1294263 RepID=W4V5N2_9FIRM|nr:hypothetical protein [Acetivibrio straminisolvens]GAE88064.1 membrane protein [Acetivibrio straminisolvens JCM 21531]
MTIILAYLIVSNGATPKKYRVVLGTISGYDILSPRDIVNTIKTEENARKAASEVLPVIKDIPNAPIEVINVLDKLFFLIDEAQNSYKLRIDSISGSRRYEELTSNALSEAKAAFVKDIGELGIKLEDAR